MPAVPGAALVLATILALGGCASDRLSPGLETTILPTTIEYDCDEGRKLRVERAGDATGARATLGSRSWSLPRADGAAQEKYAEGTTAIYLDGDAALLESEGRLLARNCRSATPLPKAPAMRPYRF